MSVQYFAGPEKHPGLECASDILLCLGDLWPVGRPEKFLERLLPLCELGWKHVVYVMGILEADMLEYEVAVEFLTKLDDKIENFHFLYNTHLDIEEYKMRIFGSPLFTDMAYDADPDTPAGKKELGVFLDVNAMTSSTNDAFDVITEIAKEDTLPEGSMISQAEDGTRRRCLPISKFWWMINHKAAREALAGAVADAATLPNDWVMMVATHWQPSILLDHTPQAGSEQEKQGAPIADDSLRYSQNLPVRQYARMLDRNIVWLYAQAKHYGPARTGIGAIDEKIIFYGTPSCYVPGREKFVLDVQVMPSTLDHQLRAAESLQASGTPSSSTTTAATTSTGSTATATATATATTSTGETFAIPPSQSRE